MDQDDKHRPPPDREVPPEQDNQPHGVVTPDTGDVIGRRAEDPPPAEVTDLTDPSYVAPYEDATPVHRGYDVTSEPEADTPDGPGPTLPDDDEADNAAARAILVGGYVGAVKCTGGPTRGAQALMAWYLGAYGSQGAANLGIYLCKDIAGSGTTSLHGEGRAADLGTRPYAKPPYGWSLANALVANSKELGIQCVIFNGKIWSSSYPHAGFRPYYGYDPHNGHLHAELTWWAAQHLTAATIQAVLRKPPPAPPVKPPVKPPAVDWTKRLIMALPTLREGMGLTGPANEDVQTMQNLLQARGYWRHMKPVGGADGRWGREVTRDLIEFQKACKITPDGVCGKTTWHWLLRQQKLL